MLIVNRYIVSDAFATPWAVALQAPLFMRFPRQEYWSGFPFGLGYLPNPETKPESSALAGGFFTTEPPGKPFVLSYPTILQVPHVTEAFFFFFLLFFSVVCNLSVLQTV